MKTLKVILVFNILICFSGTSIIKADSPITDPIKVFSGKDIYASTILLVNDTLKQWFGGWRSSADLPWDRMYYSYSTDGGTTWAPYIELFTITNVQVNDPSVVRLWDTAKQQYYYIMYYTFYATNPGVPAGLKEHINYVASSTSVDGINWTHNGILIGNDNGKDLDGAWSPSAVSADPEGKTIYLYFHNNFSKRPGGILRTTLKDNGKTFDNSSTIEVVSPNVYRVNVDVSRSPNGIWWMFYDGSNHDKFNTKKMFSHDGVNWIESSSNPIQENDNYYFCTPHVYWTSNTTYTLWFGRGPSLTTFDVYKQDFTITEEVIDDSSPTFVASSVVAEPSFSASNAGDDDVNTAWSSNGSFDDSNALEWIYRDLKTPIVIDQIDLTPRVFNNVVLGFPKDFSFQFSNDAKSWREISGITHVDYASTTGVQSFRPSIATTARYVKVTCTKMTDAGGAYFFQIAEFNVKSIVQGLSQFSDNLSKISCYPNPVKDYLTIKDEDEISNSEIEIVDIKGEIILISNIPSEKTFDLSKLTKGLYFVKTRNNSNANTIKFIKN